ncbi:hypothetical protein MZM54_05345 [[Brevibacterium] frigoritolerans]|nr:hypothetical protein [Peribacillus frigoritolerans]
MRTFNVDGTIFTEQSYGEFMINKQFEESAGATINPEELTKVQIREIGLQTLEDRMMEDENVYEIHN